MARPRVTGTDAVLAAAARRLASHGIAATTVDDVAAEAGVSRATVYRYVGGKDEIAQQVIARESEAVLAQVAMVIAGSSTAATAIADAVTTALTAIAEHPVLARLTSTDLLDTLPFVTVQAAPLIDLAVTTLADAMRTAPGLTVADAAIEPALEEATRFVLSHLTTPRRHGTRPTADAAGAAAATLIAPILAG